MSKYEKAVDALRIASKWGGSATSQWGMSYDEKLKELHNAHRKIEEQIAEVQAAKAAWDKENEQLHAAIAVLEAM
jgi:hypothetical protein